MSGSRLEGRRDNCGIVVRKQGTGGVEDFHLFGESALAQAEGKE
jgi:hypothetical protein